MSAGSQIALLRRTPPANLVVWACVGVLLVLVASATDDPGVGETRDLDARALGLLGVAVGLLWWARRCPVAVAVAVVAINAWWHARGYTSGAINAPTLVALYFLGATGGRRRGIVLAGLVVGVLTATVVVGNEPWSQAVGAVGWVLAPVLFGEIVRARRALLDEYAERAERAEHERDAEVERNVDAERMRIARELHDVLAHTVTAMTVQADAALDAFDRSPDNARASLAAISASGREAIRDIRATITVLRTDPRVGERSLPSLAEIGELVDLAAGSGLHVDVASNGAPRHYPPLVELTAFRVLQESLTNVVRHAGASHADVQLEFAEDGLALRVHDDGPHAASFSRPGFGLVGMAERVSACGGQLRYGPADSGGFEVCARLPAAERP